MRCLDQNERKWWILSCLLAGAAGGMVMAAWPVIAVLVILALLAPQPKAARFAKAAVSIVIALLTYFVANPYVLANLFRNREPHPEQPGQHAGRCSISARWRRRFATRSG